MRSKTFTPPRKEDEILPGIIWGDYCQLYTPAFWKYLYYEADADAGDAFNHRLGDTIMEEIVACLLGGYGIPAEMGIKAFRQLRNASLIRHGVALHDLQRILSIPFDCNGKMRQYRFYNQKARFIYSFLKRDDLDDMPLHDDLALRNWLLSVDGIGYKTASWITRNWFCSEKVAILDVHVLRAGKFAGIFKDISKIDRNYLQLEENYLAFCQAIEVRPSNMDALIWNYMKKSIRLTLKILSSTNKP